MIKRLLQLFLLLSLSGVAVIIAVYFLLVKPYLPDIEEIADISLTVPMQVYTADEVLFAEFGERKRNLLQQHNLPEKVKTALLAIEDSRFYHHIGIDVLALMRAGIALILSGTKAQGGSTITMQLARNFFLTREKSYLRKLREIFLALRIESVYSKEEILTLYMNRVFLGQRSYGFKAAAQTYFGKDISKLNWAEAALLAGLPKAPSSLNPIKNPERAKNRRDLVLRQLYRLQFISLKEFEEALLEPIQAQLHSKKFSIQAGHVAEMARTLVKKYLPNLDNQLGIKVYTTLHANKQKAATQAVKDGLINSIRRAPWRGPENILSIEKLLGNSSITLTTDLINVTQRIESILGFKRAVIFAKDATNNVIVMIENGQPFALSAKDVKWAKTTWRLEDSVFTQAQNTRNAFFEDADNLLQTGRLKYFFLPHTISRTKVAKALQEPLPIGGIVYLQPLANGDYRLVSRPEVQAALVSLDVRNGAIRSLVGGFNYLNFKFNRAIQANRQSGSNFKPFLYAAALQNGMTAATVINDAPIAYQDNDSGFIWTPQNYSEKYFGPTRLRKALTFSRNLVSVRLAERIGVKRLIQQMQTFGFTSSDFAGNRNLALSLGSATMSPLKIARAYSVFANGGFLIEPHIIDRIVDVSGEVLYQHQAKLVCYTPCPEVEPAQLAPQTLDEDIAYIIYDILGDVIRYGTGRRAQVLKRQDLAGKTGTTNDQFDAWFSGFNRNLATTVWVGNDSPQSMGRYETGARAALPIWIDYNKVALANAPTASPPQPSNLIKIRINEKTGRFTRSSEPKTTLMELFRTQYAPTTAGAQPANATNNSRIFNGNRHNDRKNNNSSNSDILNSLYN